MNRLNKIAHLLGYLARVACITTLTCLVIGCKSYEYSTAAPLQPEQEDKSVKTVWVPSARVSVTVNQQVFNARVNFATTIDSLLIWSIQPIAGMELYRMEATPDEIRVFDKTTMTYVSATYAQLNQYAPELTFDHLQAVAIGDILPMGRTSTLRSYTILGYTIVLEIDYQDIRYGVPVNMNRLSTLRFEQKQIEELL